jgi:hypothetical protein
MLRYSELSKPQKIIIDKMKSGFILRYTMKGYSLNKGEDSIIFRTDTPNSLLKRHYIIECFHDWDTGMREYCLNADITY